MNPYSNLAKKSVETFIKEKRIIAPPKDLPKEFFERRAGVFVTIEKNGQLRGCLGTYLPTKINIAEEIIHNAIAAATQDYRFEPVHENELDSLNYTVYILSLPESVKDIKELNPKKYGIIVKTFPLIFPNEEISFDENITSKTGLLLPDLEGIDTVEQQISIACQKAGINPEKEKFYLYKFTVEKHK